jgi:hypothetical protein
MARIASETLRSPVARVSFTKDLYTPKKNDEGKDRWSCSLVFSPEAQETPQFKAIVEAVKKVAAEDIAKNHDGAKPKNYKAPFHQTSDDPKWYGWAEDGSVYINVGSSQKPPLFDVDGEEALSNDVIYSGCFVKAALLAYSYDTKSKGVSLGLQGLRKVKDGERLGGGGGVGKDFFDEDEDDAPAKKPAGATASSIFD